jgi:hypothetical protein
VSSLCEPTRSAVGFGLRGCPAGRLFPGGNVAGFVEVHRNEVRVRGKFLVGSLNSNENRSVVAALVMTALAATATGTCREHLLWTAQHGGYLRPPG